MIFHCQCRALEDLSLGGSAHLAFPNTAQGPSVCLVSSPSICLFFQLARLYPNMELELETSPESAPFLTFTPGNVTFMPVMDIQAFVLDEDLRPKSAGRKPLFQIRAVSLNLSRAIKGHVCYG